MTIEKAIEILTSLANRLWHISQADEQASARLGIEALRRIEATRLVRNTGTIVPLPGESE